MTDAQRICLNLIIWAVKRFGPTVVAWALRKVLGRAKKGKGPSPRGSRRLSRRRLAQRSKSMLR